MPEPLLRFRPEFPILDRCTYLASHSLGALPRRGRTGLDRFAGEWDELGVRAWREGWWELGTTLGDRVGRFLGASPGTITMQPNVTLASAVFLSALDFSGDRCKLVTTDLDFPSLLYLYERTPCPGMRVSRVPSEDGVRIDLERLLDAIDHRTRVVAICHVLFRSAFIQDVAAIVAKAHHVGALVLVDLYQSAGTIPVELERWNVDAAVGGHLKWMLGGPGAAFLYVHPDHHHLQPRLTGWFAHEEPFAFDLPPHRPRPGAERFQTGTPSISALRVAEASLTLLEEAGVAEIRERSLTLTGRIIDRCLREGWPIRSPQEISQRGGTVSIDPAEAYGCSQALLARDIVIDYRPGSGIRMSPHFYNSESEIDEALDTLAGVIRSQEWRRHSGRRGTVT